MSTFPQSAIDASLEAIAQLKTPHALAFLERAAELLAATFRAGNKVVIAGNGGSLCEATHFAEELTGQFHKPRPALPAIALAESGHITCVGNDFGFDTIFSRGLEAYGKQGDVFIGLSTSGNSPNIIRAFATAKEREMATIAFLGKDGGALAGVADLELIVEGSPTSDRIQEAHLTAIHIVVEGVEQRLFSPPAETQSSTSLCETR